MCFMRRVGPNEPVNRNPRDDSSIPLYIPGARNQTMTNKGFHHMQRPCVFPKEHQVLDGLRGPQSEPVMTA